MKSTVALIAALVAPAIALADKTPTAPPPPGCSSTYDGAFNVVIPDVGESASSIAKRDDSSSLPQCANPVIKLKDGVLTDSFNRLGSIVANGQFQFDPPPGQDKAIYTAGWSYCGNDHLALGGNTTFYGCLSGTFYNFYNYAVNPGPGACKPVYFLAIPCKESAGQLYSSSIPSISATSGSTSPGSSATASANPDGQVTANSVALGSSSSSCSSSVAADVTTPLGTGSLPTGTVIPPYPAGNVTSPAGSTGITPTLPTTTSPPTTPGATSPATGTPITLPNGSTCPACSTCGAATVTVTSTVTAGPGSPSTPGSAVGSTGVVANSPISPTTSPITPFTGGAMIVRSTVGWSGALGGMLVGVMALW